MRVRANVALMAGIRDPCSNLYVLLGMLVLQCGATQCKETT